MSNWHAGERFHKEKTGILENDIGVPFVFGMFLFLTKFQPQCSYKIVLIKKEVMRLRRNVGILTKKECKAKP